MGFNSGFKGLIVWKKSRMHLTKCIEYDKTVDGSEAQDLWV